MSFLLDTNVVSELRKRTPDSNVMAWFEQADQSDLYLSVLTLGELTKGIAKLGQTEPEAAASLDHWLKGIEQLFLERVIPIDTPTARVWGEFNAGAPLPVIDSLLAATAKVHGFTLVTRNVKDVAATGISVVNPWNHDPS